MSALPLRGPEFRRAATIQEHLLSLKGGSAERVHEVVDDLGALLGCRDVSVAIHDSSRGDRAVSLWFREFPANKLRNIAESTRGHAPFEFLRSIGLRTITFDVGDKYGAGGVRRTDFFRSFEAQSGLYHGLVSHLGTEPGESLGRIVFYREKDEGDFDEDRVRLLEILRPALSRAARGVMSANIAEDDSEAALVNAGGQILWMSDGFRFLWNAVDPLRVDYGRLPVAETLAGSDFGRAVAFHIIGLEDSATNFRPPHHVIAPFRSGGGGGLLARFDVVSDHLMGFRGEMLRVSLRRIPAEESLAKAPAAAPAD